MYYKSAFVIPEMDRIITQLNLLGLIAFDWTNVCITEFGMEEVQRLYAYKKS